MDLRDFAQHTIDGIYTYHHSGILHTHCGAHPSHTLMHETIRRDLGQDLRQLIERQDVETGIIQDGVL